MNIKSLSMDLGVLAITALAGQAGASEVASPLSQVRVSYADLNLERPEGAATLYARIVHAARSVCLPADRQDIESKVRHRACVADAVQRAVAGVAAPELTRYYEARAGKSSSAAVVAKAGK